MKPLLCLLLGHAWKYRDNRRTVVLMGRQAGFWKPEIVCTRCGAVEQAGGAKS